MRPKQVDGRFKVGEKVMAVWTKKSKYPGAIRSVHPNGQHYRVIFDDGYQKTVSGTKISRMTESDKEQIPSQLPSLPASYSATQFSTASPNVVGSLPVDENMPATKEDRRQRKRKFKVNELFRTKRSRRKEKAPARARGGTVLGDAESNDDRMARHTLRENECSIQWNNGEPQGELASIVESEVEHKNATSNTVSREAVILEDCCLSGDCCKRAFRRQTGNSIGKWNVFPISEQDSSDSTVGLNTHSASMHSLSNHPYTTQQASSIHPPALPSITPQESPLGVKLVKILLPMVPTTGCTTSRLASSLSPHLVASQPRDDSSVEKIGRTFQSESDGYGGVGPTLDASRSLQSRLPTFGQLLNERPMRVNSVDGSPAAAGKRRSTMPSLQEMIVRDGSHDSNMAQVFPGSAWLDSSISRPPSRTARFSSEVELVQETVGDRMSVSSWTEQLQREELISRPCEFTEDYGFLIPVQCDSCLRPQHVLRNKIGNEDKVPYKYVCQICINGSRQRDSQLAQFPPGSAGLNCSISHLASRTAGFSSELGLKQETIGDRMNISPRRSSGLVSASTSQIPAVTAACFYGEMKAPSADKQIDRKSIESPVKQLRRETPINCTCGFTDKDRSQAPQKSRSDSSSSSCQFSAVTLVIDGPQASQENQSHTQQDTPQQLPITPADQIVNEWLDSSVSSNRPSQPDEEHNSSNLIDISPTKRLTTEASTSKPKNVKGRRPGPASRTSRPRLKSPIVLLERLPSSALCRDRTQEVRKSPESDNSDSDSSRSSDDFVLKYFSSSSRSESDGQTSKKNKQKRRRSSQEVRDSSNDHGDVSPGDGWKAACKRLLILPSGAPSCVEQLKLTAYNTAYCTLCNKPQTRLDRHLVRVHKMDKKVASKRAKLMKPSIPKYIKGSVVMDALKPFWDRVELHEGLRKILSHTGQHIYNDRNPLIRNEKISNPRMRNTDKAVRPSKADASGPFQGITPKEALDDPLTHLFVLTLTDAEQKQKDLARIYGGLFGKIVIAVKKLRKSVDNCNLFDPMSWVAEHKKIVEQMEGKYSTNYSKQMMKAFTYCTQLGSLDSRVWYRNPLFPKDEEFNSRVDEVRNLWEHAHKLWIKDSNRTFRENRYFWKV